MTSTAASETDRAFLRRAIEITLRVGLLLALAAWCFRIIEPFLTPILWAVIISVAVYPAYRRLERWLGGRRKLTATLATVLALSVLLAPTVTFVGSLAKGTSELAEDVRDGKLDLPPAPESLLEWPVVGAPLHKLWTQAVTNLPAAARQLAPQIKTAGEWLMSSVAAIGMGILQTVVALIIAGVLLANADASERVANAVAARLTTARGREFVSLAVATVRSVANGVVGVALIQALLAGVGMFAIGLSAAGVLSVVVLVLAVVQLPTLLVLGPVMAYVFSTHETLPASVFAVWAVLVGLSDTFLKPVFLGRGMDIPMPVILIGAIGGMVTSGIIGLFVGAVVLAVGYQLFLAWLHEEDETPEAKAQTVGEEQGPASAGVAGAQGAPSR